MTVIFELLRQEGGRVSNFHCLPVEEGCDLMGERMSYVLVLATLKLRF